MTDESRTLGRDDDAIARGRGPRSRRPTAHVSTSGTITAEQEAVFGRLTRRRETLARQDSLLPCLLIRGMPGDHGRRPLPANANWWLTPDILLAPHGAFNGPTGPGAIAGPVNDPSPIADQPYDIFVRIFNLGALRADGAVLEVWWSSPNAGGFTVDNTQPIDDDPDPMTSRQKFLLPPLDDCDHYPGCIGLFQMPVPWRPREGHECVVARVTCTMDSADPTNSRRLDPVGNRHVAQRNYTALHMDEAIDPTIFGLLRNLGSSATTLRIWAGTVATSIEGFARGERAAQIMWPERDTAVLTARSGHVVFAVGRDEQGFVGASTEVAAECGIHVDRLLSRHARGVVPLTDEPAVLEHMADALSTSMLTGEAFADRLGIDVPPSGLLLLTVEGLGVRGVTGGYTIAFDAS